MQKRLNEHFLICACCTCNTTQCSNWTYDIGAGVTQAEMMFTPPRCNLLLSIAQTPWKVLKCRKWIHPAGVHFRLPLLAMPPGSWSNATTRNTLISTKGNVYADPLCGLFWNRKRLRVQPETHYSICAMSSAQLHNWCVHVHESKWGSVFHPALEPKYFRIPLRL